MFILSVTIGSCNIQLFHKNSSRNAERGLFWKSHGRNKEVKIFEPRTVLKAKNKQEANQRKLKSDYEKSVKRSQKRTIDIQTTEVQARMKQDRENIATRDKERKKKEKASLKKAGKKYK